MAGVSKYVDGTERMTAALGFGVDVGRWRLDLGGAVIAQPRRNLYDAPMTSSGPRIQPDIALRFPKEWLGITLNPDFGRLNEIEREIGQQMR